MVILQPAGGIMVVRVYPVQALTYYYISWNLSEQYQNK